MKKLWKNAKKIVKLLKASSEARERGDASTAVEKIDAALKLFSADHEGRIREILITKCEISANVGEVGII